MTTAAQMIAIDGDVWDVRADGKPGVPLVRAERGNYRSWGRSVSEEERIATAELFAAAPDLLTSLKHAVEIIEKHVPRDALGTNGDGDPDVPGGYREWPLLDEYLHYMRAAIERCPEKTTQDANPERGS